MSWFLIQLIKYQLNYGKDYLIVKLMKKYLIKFRINSNVIMILGVMALNYIAKTN
jgi:hypothetical protein